MRINILFYCCTSEYVTGWWWCWPAGVRLIYYEMIYRQTRKKVLVAAGAEGPTAIINQYNNEWCHKLSDYTGKLWPYVPVTLWKKRWYNVNLIVLLFRNNLKVVKRKLMLCNPGIIQIVWHVCESVSLVVDRCIWQVYNYILRVLMGAPGDRNERTNRLLAVCCAVSKLL